MNWQKRVAAAAFMVPLFVILLVGLAASNGQNDHMDHNSGKGGRKKHHGMGHSMDRPAPVKEDVKPIRMIMGELNGYGGGLSLS
jgi:hypothetical protein